MSARPISFPQHFSQAFFDQAPFPMWIKSRTGVVLEANQAADSLFGINLAGKTVGQFMHARDAKRAQRYERDLLATRQQSSQWLCVNGVMVYATRFLMERDGETVIAGAAVRFT
jgi:PAS domain-containing protein